MTPLQFQKDGRHYTCVVQLPAAIIAKAPHPDGCCTSVLCMRPDGVACQHPIAGDGTRLIAEWAGKFGIAEDGTHPQIHPTHWSFQVDDGAYVHVEPMNPTTIPGTSVLYTAVALTLHGVIGRREMHKPNTRIRVCAQTGFTVPLIQADLVCVNEEGAKWGTSDAGSHYAHNGNGVHQLRALVARGVTMLLDAEQKEWNAA